MNEQIADPKQSHNAIQHNIDPILITDSQVRCQSINTQDQEASRPSRFLLVFLACGVTCNLAFVRTRYLQLGNRKGAKMYQISIFIFTFDFCFNIIVLKKN